jgi:glycosyltransferase involved in cell wall biosynthesis
MKILQVCLKPPYPPRDGGSMAMFGLACSLSRMGHEITVLTMYTPKHKLSDEDKLRFGDIMEVQAVYVDTTVHLTALLKNLLFSGKPYNALRFVSAEFENKLVDMLSAKTYDIVQLEGLYLAPYIPAIRRNSRGLIAFRAHNVEHEIWQRLALSEKNLYRKWYFGTLAKRILHYETEIMNSYDLLVPITERDLEHFNRMGNTSSAHVCPAGVDIDTVPSGGTIHQAPKYDFSIFFLGSLDWMPNQEGLLWFISKVFPELHHRNPGLKFHIAGRNLPDKLLQKLKKPGLVVHGEVTDAAKFMKTYGILVAPCFSGSGMRVKVIEAMAKGKPVVTTPLGAEGLPVRHGKNIILANQAEEFLQQTEKLLKYPDFYQKIGQNAYNFVAKKFNNATLASGLADFYKMNLK